MSKTAINSTKINITKNLQRYREREFELSEQTKSLEIGIFDYLEMLSVFVDPANAEFSDLILVQNSEVALVRHLLKCFIKTSKKWR
ncbi:MAG: hypothetical protein QXU98_06225 [Candidatus Parvarchaeota archaeon]